MLLVGCTDTSTKYREVKKNDNPKFEGLHKKVSSLFGHLPKEAINPNNPITAEKIALGKKLYFDKRLSKDNTISCNSCHNLRTGGVDNLPFSHGNDGGLGGRNSPTTLNAALHFSQFWDGRNKDVEEQAGGPILNPVEMAMPSKEFVVNRLSNIDEYITYFEKAFPNDNKPLTFANIQKAIGVFERKLMTPSRFDDYIKGDMDALSLEEKKGLNTFIESGCTTCHAGNNFGGTMFQKFGLFAPYWKETKSKKIDGGRFEVTHNESDKYFFKVPTLRNVALTAPYFHDGSVASLTDAVQIMSKIQTNKELSHSKATEIVTFLKSLNGEIDPELME